MSGAGTSERHAPESPRGARRGSSAGPVPGHRCPTDGHAPLPRTGRHTSEHGPQPRPRACVQLSLTPKITTQTIPRQPRDTKGPRMASKWQCNECNEVTDKPERISLHYMSGEEFSLVVCPHCRCIRSSLEEVEPDGTPS